MPLTYLFRLVMKKSVFKVLNHVWIKPGCTTEYFGWMLEISNLGSRGVINFINENKDAYNGAADLQICFRVEKKTDLLMTRFICFHSQRCHKAYDHTSLAHILSLIPTGVSHLWIIVGAVSLVMTKSAFCLYAKAKAQFSRKQQQCSWWAQMFSQPSNV